MTKDKGGGEDAERPVGKTVNARAWAIISVIASGVSIATVLGFFFGLGEKSNEIERNKEELSALRASVESARSDVASLSSKLSEVSETMASQKGKVEDTTGIREDVERLKIEAVGYGTQISSIDANIGQHIRERREIDEDLRCAAFEALKYSFWHVCVLSGGDPADMSLKCNGASHIRLVSPFKPSEVADCPQYMY